MDSSASMRTILVVASSAEVGERVKRLLHGTGKPLLALDIVTDVARLAAYVDSWRPHVLAVDAGLKLSEEEWRVPIAVFDPLAFDPQTLANEILHLPPGAPAEAPLSIGPKRPAHGVAIGFQGVKGGVGTTTAAAGTAEAAVRCGYRAAIVDLAGDCAVTLRARADEQDGHLFLTESGIMIVQGAADLRQVWQVLSEEYDVVVIDAGRSGEHVAEVRTLIRLGVLFFLVVTDKEIEFLQPGRYPGYRLFLNRQPDRRWWQWDVAGGAPYDPEMTDRVNRGEFGTVSAFLLGMQEFTTRVVQREIV
jgi:CheY-like chemotaxis protein